MRRKGPALGWIMGEGQWGTLQTDRSAVRDCGPGIRKEGTEYSQQQKKKNDRSYCEQGPGFAS